MSESLFDILLDQLRVQEGLELKPYADTQGYLTIGYGRNLSSRGISKTEAEILLSNDARNAIEESRHIFENFDKLSINRQTVIANMIFNLGLNKFTTFVKFISAVQAGDYKLAASEMIDSKWAKQVKGRAQFLSKLMEEG